MGVMWGLISVAIASLAQLSLGFAMMRLPSIAHPLAFISGLGAFNAATGAIRRFGGVSGFRLLLAENITHARAQQSLCATESQLCACLGSLNAVTRFARRFQPKSDARRIVYYGGGNADFSARQIMMACASTAAIRRRNNSVHQRFLRSGVFPD